jgi:2-methylcitrate dehydratase PrpD
MPDAVKDKTGINPKAFIPTIATGAAIGTMKGVGEKSIEARLERALKRSPHLSKVLGPNVTKAVPWATARGGMSAVAGVGYLLSTLYALKHASVEKQASADPLDFVSARFVG